MRNISIVSKRKQFYQKEQVSCAAGRTAAEWRLFMEAVGIIAEYNPFHTGHEYHIRRARQEAGADYAVVVMSPDFVQRGTPSVFDKETRTRAALLGGADLVLELPVCYASGSAEYFAQGAVALLGSLNVVRSFCFGSETPDPGLFRQTAAVLNEEPESFREQLQSSLKQGQTFPRARMDALTEYLGSDMADFLHSPNNILGIEYCRAVEHFSFPMTPIPILRAGSGYHNTEFASGEYASATALRKAMKEGRTADCLASVPEQIRELFLGASRNRIDPDDLLPYLTSKLLSENSFTGFLDASSDLSDRIERFRYECIGKSYEEMTGLLKTKQITESRIRRMLLHILLNIRTEDLELFRSRGTVFYARILGFRKSAAPLLHELKQLSRIPLIAKPSAGESVLRQYYSDHSEKAEASVRMYRSDLSASHFYEGIRSEKYRIPFCTEYQKSPIIISD